jgi:type I restriction enzyme S subunit
VSKFPTVALTEVADFTRGLTYTKSDEVDFSSNIVLRANNVDLSSGTILYEDLKYLRDSFLIPSEKKVKSGSLIICTASGSKSHLGKVAMIPESIDMAFGGFMGMLSPRDGLNGKFLYYALRSPAYLDFISKVTDGANINNLKFSDLGLFEFPLPPLDEQKRIVAKLNEAMEECDRCQEYQQVQIDQAENLYQAAIRTIIESHDSELGVYRLGDIALKIGSGATPKGGANAYVESGISLIRSLNVYDSDFRMRNLAFITEEQAQKLQNVVVEKNDVLLNITGASIARTCVVDESILPARVNQHVAIIRSDATKVYPEYLGLMLVSRATKDRLLNIGDAAGTTRQALTKVDLENFEIRIPEDISEQVLRCRKAAEVFDLVNELKRNLNAQRNLMEKFKASILSAAFTGAL